jgi:hypothetical protein
MTFNRYGLIWVSAALSMTGVMWYGETHPWIRGEHLAALRARVEETKIAYLFGEQVPADYIVSSTTLVSCAVVGGNTYATIVSGTENFFSFSDSGYKTIRISVADDAPGTGIQFSIQRDGANAGQLMVIPIGAGETAYGGDDLAGSVILHPQAAWVPRGGSFDFQVRPDAIGYTIDPAGRIGNFALWDDVYTRGLCVCRDFVLDAFADGKIFWLGTDAEIGDGDVIASAAAGLYLSASNATETIHYYYYSGIVSNRFSDILTTATMRDAARLTCPSSGSISNVIAGTNFPVAAIFYDCSNSNGAAYGANKNWWMHHAITTNAFVFGCERTSNQAVRAALKWITRANLDEGKKITDRLTRTIAILPPSYLSATNGFVTTYAATTNVSGELFGVKNALDKTEVMAALEATATHTATTNSAFSDDLFSCDFNGSYESGEGHDGASDYDTSVATISETLRRYEGCRLSYPCAYAFASGYVARVVIYAVGGDSGIVNTTPDLRTHGSDGESNTAAEVASYWPRPYDQQGNLHGIFASGFEYSDAAQVLGTHFGEYRGMNADYPQIPVRYRLSLLADSGADPTAAPVFSIGPTVPYYPPVETYSLAEWSYANGNSPDPWWTVTQSRFGFYQRVEIRFFVAVVDWNWKFLEE